MARIIALLPLDRLLTMTMLLRQSARNGTSFPQNRAGKHSWLFKVISALTLLLSWAATQPALAVEGDIAVVPAYVGDPLTGRALFGYDPVAYFLDGQAKKGADNIIFRWKGNDWHFVSAANLERFRAAPDLYAPTLQGNDPQRLTAFKLVAADPRIFVIKDGTLWLFRSQESKRRFLTDPNLAYAARIAWDAIGSGK
jgi:YHS domain-containing protein